MENYNRRERFNKEKFLKACSSGDVDYVKYCIESEKRLNKKVDLQKALKLSFDNLQVSVIKLFKNNLNLTLDQNEVERYINAYDFDYEDAFLSKLKSSSYYNYKLKNSSIHKCKEKHKIYLSRIKLLIDANYEFDAKYKLINILKDIKLAKDESDLIEHLLENNDEIREYAKKRLNQLESINEN